MFRLAEFSQQSDVQAAFQSIILHHSFTLPADYIPGGLSLFLPPSLTIEHSIVCSRSAIDLALKEFNLFIDQAMQQENSSLADYIPQALILRGLCHIARGDHSAGQADLAQVPSLEEFSSNDPDLLMQLGFALETCGLTERAEQMFATAAELDPEFITPHFERALEFHALGEINEALRLLNRVLSYDHNHILARRLRGVCQSLAGRYLEALQGFSSSSLQAFPPFIQHE